MQSETPVLALWVLSWCAGGELCFPLGNRSVKAENWNHLHCCSWNCVLLRNCALRAATLRATQHSSSPHHSLTRVLRGHRKWRKLVWFLVGCFVGLELVFFLEKVNSVWLQIDSIVKPPSQWAPLAFKSQLRWEWAGKSRDFKDQNTH